MAAGIAGEVHLRVALCQPTGAWQSKISSVAGGDQNSAAASADFALMFVCAML